ncbi:MAG: OmpA family protein [Gammaproteobacteria bacterium]|nr:OmpA family protein [Gammaproteobacteria bacterium]
MLIATLFLGLGIASSAAASDWLAAEDQWYFSPLIGATFEDKDRASDQGFSAALGFGKQLNNRWALEFSLFGGVHRGVNEFLPMGVGVDLLRDLGSTGLISPYVVLGTGWISPNIVEGVGTGPELDYDNFMATLGLGMIAPLGDSAARFRGEVRYRRDFHSPDFSDLLLMGGLYIPIGDASASGPSVSPDSDGDGVPNDVDRCPATGAGAHADEFGCELDGDGDGVANSKDRCPNTPKSTNVDRRGCAIQVDSDGDGVSDNDDQCPDTSPSASVNAVGCELDSDGDGVVDSLDSCNDTPEGARIDVRGCTIRDKIVLPGVRFELNSADLVGESTAILDQAAQTLRRHPELKVEACGFTDTSGPEVFNEYLSQKRAESVRRYLISKGANGDNISATGYGEANPIADNATRPGRQRNRRVHLRILN